MPKFKMCEPIEDGWQESELESDNLVDAMKETLASKDIFVAPIEE